MKKFVTVVVAMAASLVLVVLPASPAFAFTNVAITGSEAMFYGPTSELSAKDTKADGKSAIAELRSNSTSAIKIVTNSGGNGTTVKATVLMSTNYEIRACVQDIGGGGAKTCGAWTKGTR